MDLVKSALNYCIIRQIEAVKADNTALFLYWYEWERRIRARYVSNLTH